ncbi:MAG: MBL fold metallo-hydrolase [Leptospiraceae bacterium]|nr:MBL fold metallo-hydrolase [Leptospiraceae bacterium]
MKTLVSSQFSPVVGLVQANLLELENFTVTSFPVWPLGCNCSIIECKSSKEAIVVDPGGEEEKILKVLKERGLTVSRIVHTHAHFDHCLGTHGLAEGLREVNPNAEIQIGLHQGDSFLYRNLGMQCGWFGLPPMDAKEAINLDLEDGMELPVGNHRLHVLHTPGHTPGSCCFSVEGLVFSGDTLFAGGIGRTDLPGGDSEAILKSIRGRLFTLDDGTAVIPGHGGFTRIYEEKHSNPFF